MRRIGPLSEPELIHGHWCAGNENYEVRIAQRCLKYQPTAAEAERFTDQIFDLQFQGKTEVNCLKIGNSIQVSRRNFECKESF